MKHLPRQIRLREPSRATPACSQLWGVPRVHPEPCSRAGGTGRASPALPARPPAAALPVHPAQAVTRLWAAAAAMRCRADYLCCLQSPSAQSDVLQQHPPFVRAEQP